MRVNGFKRVPRHPGQGRGMFFLLGVLLLAIQPVPRALAQGGTAAPTDKAPAVQVPAKATVEELFVDFLHYARIGRFTAADAFAKALLAHPELDPVVVLNAANKDRKSVETLLILIKNSTIGENAQKVLDLIEKGENLRRQDLERIKANIDLLSGDPQQEFMATARLMESGEYAVPAIVQTLLDPTKAEVGPRVVANLPKIGKGAVNPLVQSLAVGDENVRLHLIRSLGEIGYPQAIPYLLKVTVDSKMPVTSKEAAGKAIIRIEEITGRTFPGSPDEQFLRLAEKYYNEEDTVRADPRLADANLWYWDATAQALTRVVIPEFLFGPLMAMRCAEEALLLQGEQPEAQALWLAANIRREGRLGMNVESGDPNEKGGADPTRPANFPRALYFTQAAGPRYAHRVLKRAVATTDSVVALGAIEALRATAGESSLVGFEDDKQPLTQALRFPDVVVRLRAALALGAALPKSGFEDSQFVVPVLATALSQSGREQVLVVDPDETNLNRVVGAQRAMGREVIGERSFFRAVDRARGEFHVLSGLLLATDIQEPTLDSALTSLRGEFAFSKTPVVLLTKSKQSVAAEDAAKASDFVTTVEAAAADAAIEDALSRVRAQAGQVRLEPGLAQVLALQAAETLRDIAADGRTVYDFGVAEPALIGALTATEEDLQSTAASVLAHAGTPTAQRAIAHVALDSGNTEALRLSAFDSLAESARNHGSLLEDRQVSELIRIVRGETDLTLRTAATKALGALNLTTDRASEIIRGYYGG